MFVNCCLPSKVLRAAWYFLGQNAGYVVGNCSKMLPGSLDEQYKWHWQALMCFRSTFFEQVLHKPSARSNHLLLNLRRVTLDTEHKNSATKKIRVASGASFSHYIEAQWGHFVRRNNYNKLLKFSVKCKYLAGWSVCIIVQYVIKCPFWSLRMRLLFVWLSDVISFSLTKLKRIHIQ